MQTNKLEEHPNPVLIYLKDGKLLESFGGFGDQRFTTTYYCLDSKDTFGITLKLLRPSQFGGKQFLVPTNICTQVKEDCIIGIQAFPHIPIAKRVTSHFQFHDCFELDFTIPKNCQEAILWQTDPHHHHSCTLEITYHDGDADSLEIIAYSLGNRVKSFKLDRNIPLTLEIQEAQKIVIAKETQHSMASGSFTLKVYSDIHEKFIL